MTTEWDALPDTIKTFMTALDTREDGRALATLTTDAVVTDEGHDYTGHDEIGAWLATSAGEYTYTSEFTGATTTDTHRRRRAAPGGQLPRRGRRPALPLHAGRRADQPVGDRAMSKRWFITGGTPGSFGVAFAEAALETGDRVVLTSRRPQELATWAEQYGDRVLVVPLDLTDAAQVQRAVHAAEEHFGGIDVLVNNAGRGWYGSIEGMDESSLRAMFELNFFAVLSVTRAVLPGMRARGNGWIVNVSSVAGLVSAPGFGYYSATKFAIEAVTDALRDEVAAQGISVLGSRTGSVPHERLRRLRERARRGDDSGVSRHAGAGPRRLR